MRPRSHLWCAAALPRDADKLIEIEAFLKGVRLPQVNPNLVHNKAKRIYLHPHHVYKAANPLDS